MEKFLIGEDSLTLENERIASLKYYLLEQSKIIEETGENLIAYGIEIEKSEGSNVEKDFVLDITTQKECALNITNTLKNNKITPIHLKDIIIDML